MTRWNSILFMVRSVLKLTPTEYKTIRDQLPKTTTKQKRVAKNFDINATERERLEELVAVLDPFEFVTDEFQSNEVSISRVYPCIEFLLTKLGKDLMYAKHTKELRKDLIDSLNKRFGALIKNEVYVVSTFLGKTSKQISFHFTFKII